MKIILDRKAFNEAITHVARAVSTKSTIPALEGIMILTEEESIKLVSYNLEIGMTTTLDARIMESGEIIINAHLLCDIVRRLPGEEITLSTDDKNICHIESGSAKFDIMGMDTAEFPEMPSLNESKRLELSGETLKSMVRQTIFAVAVSDAKPVHTGILFDMKDGILRLVAVDGFRLAIREENVASQDTIKFIATGSAVSEATKIISDEEETVVINIGRRHISFEIGNFILISRLLDGEFIDYENTVPKVFASTVRADTRSLIDTVERISLVSNDRLKSPLRCNIRDDVMDISCVTSMGKAEDYCAINLDGAPIEIGFNNKYLLDALRAAETDEVLLEFNGSFAPMIVKPVSGSAFTFMVMPMRLKNEN